MSEGPLDPARLPVEALEKILRAAGWAEVSRERIEADFTGGAPRNPDGTVHLVRYAAWLVREVARGA
ncbi:MAG: hypothetical protein AB7F75_01320 [Planctomycetota bacterium]